MRAARLHNHPIFVQPEARSTGRWLTRIKWPRQIIGVSVSVYRIAAEAEFDKGQFDYKEAEAVACRKGMAWECMYRDSATTKTGIQSLSLGFESSSQRCLSS